MVETTDKSTLLPLRAEVVGAAGDWQGFNPVLRAERVVFPAGNLRNVYVELDFFAASSVGHGCCDASTAKAARSL